MGVKAADLPQGSGKATQKKQCSNQVSKDEELFVKSGNGTEVQRARDLKEFNPMDCSLPGSSVHGILQARVLEWGAIAFSTEVP